DFGEVDYATPPKDDSEEAAGPPNQDEKDPWQDGPMQSLMDIEKLPDYPRYAARLGLEGRFQDNATRLQHLNVDRKSPRLNSRRGHDALPISDFDEVAYATPPNDDTEEAAGPPNQDEKDPWQDAPMQSLMDIE